MIHGRRAIRDLLEDLYMVKQSGKHRVLRIKRKGREAE
jgi:hypothetical protein